MNTVLIGFKSCGKTSVGRALAAQLARPFVDTDQQVINYHFSQTQLVLSIPDIYQKYGEHYFREVEKVAISGLTTLHNAVIATGGGSVLDEENVKNLKINSQLIYLDLSLALLNTRIHQQSLPVFIDAIDSHARVAALYTTRKTIYEKIADVTIKVDHQSVSSIVNTLAEIVLAH